MNALKTLIALKPKKVDPIKEISPEISNDIALTYHEDAKQKCRNASGNASILKTCLVEVFESFKEESRVNSQEQTRLKAPFVQDQKRQESELARRNVLKEMKEKSMDDLTDQIKRIDQDIAEVPNNPGKFGLDAAKKPKAQFYIGLLILLPITLYLVVFYISASYSAFFKDFMADTTVLAAIFDGQALSKAYNDPNGGWLQVAFVSTIPFAFMGLGYLIHMFQKGKSLAKLKITSLIVVTFVFDAILAYQIEKKIFDFEKLPGEVFNLKLAFESVEFWGIIFAGFIVYLIWGLVFDFVMNEHDNMDKVKGFITTLKIQKSNLELEKDGLKKEKDSIHEEITSIKGKINELQSKIDGFVFEQKRYLNYHSQYLTGWLLTIGGEIALSKEQKDILIEECNHVSAEHLKEFNVSNENHENIVYS